MKPFRSKRTGPEEDRHKDGPGPGTSQPILAITEECGSWREGWVYLIRMFVWNIEKSVFIQCSSNVKFKTCTYTLRICAIITALYYISIRNIYPGK